MKNVFIIRCYLEEFTSFSSSTLSSIIVAIIFVVAVIKYLHSMLYSLAGSVLQDFIVNISDSDPRNMNLASMFTFPSQPSLCAMVPGQLEPRTTVSLFCPNDMLPGTFVVIVMPNLMSQMVVCEVAVYANRNKGGLTTLPFPRLMFGGVSTISLTAIIGMFHNNIIPECQVKFEWCRARASWITV